MLASATKVYAMSEHTRRRLLDIHRLPPSQLGVLLHPPSRTFTDALHRHRSVTGRSQLGKNSVLRLLFVGRADDPRKNISLLFDAFRLLERDGFPVRLSVVGPHTERWARSQRLSPNIELLGAIDIDQLAALYLAHDALVLSSRQEGFGIVVAEAMHAGLPVVTTASGGPEDIVRQSKAGFIAGFTPGEFADAIRALLTDLEVWRAASRHGEEFAASELSFERLTNQVGCILTQVMAEATPSHSPFATSLDHDTVFH